jgi:CubicO group peptidase (beta-lactamase class C family)
MTMTRTGFAMLVGLLLLSGPALAADGLTARQVGQARAAGLDPDKLPVLRAELQRFVDTNQIAGAVTVIGRRGHVGSVEAVGLRDREAKAPMTADTIFRMASMTKMVTAVAVMMLEDDGKLAVEDDVEKHLPEFRGLKLISRREGDTITLVDPPRKITIRDLLTHTSGMRCQPPAGFADIGRKKDRPLSEAVIAYSQQPLETPPGATWRYCGTAFETLGRVIEVASGKSYEAFLRQRLLGPLGMKDTTFRLTAAQARRLAANYNKEGEGAAAHIVRAENQGARVGDPVVYTNPGGGLYSTANDYARLLQMLLDKGQARGRALLKPETWAKLTRVHYQPSDIKLPAPPPKAGEPPKAPVGFSAGLGMGLGVQVVMTPAGVSEALTPGSFGHGGAHGTQGWVDPGNDAFYLLMIQRQGFGNGDQSDVRRAFQRLGAAALVRPTAGVTAPRPGPR